MIKIIDYGLGNVRALLNIYKQLNIPAAIAKTASDLIDTSRIILPGVGAFDQAMHLLQNSGMREPLDDLVLSQKIPILGICVGMQILANSSEEGCVPGLGWIPGAVKKWHPTHQTLRLPMPHMGWNDIVKSKINSSLFKELTEEARFYFLHSYYFECNQAENSLAETNYGGIFTCAVHSENIYGVQFHPEKSHQFGVQLLKNFAEI